MNDFNTKINASGMNKRIIRLIQNKTVCFGPKRKGPNILINKFIKKEDSFFYRLQIICN